MLGAQLLPLAGLLWRAPLEAAGVHRQGRFLVLGAPQVLLDQLRGDADHVLALPVLHQVQTLATSASGNGTVGLSFRVFCLWKVLT